MQIEQKASISLPPGSSDSEESMCNAGDQGSIPGLGRSPEEGNGYPLYYSCLENSMDIGDWQATVYGGHKESDATEQLSFFFHLLGLLYFVYSPAYQMQLRYLEEPHSLVLDHPLLTP